MPFANFDKPKIEQEKIEAHDTHDLPKDELASMDANDLPKDKLASVEVDNLPIDVLKYVENKEPLEDLPKEGKEQIIKEDVNNKEAAVDKPARLPREKGIWEGEPGESVWVPDGTAVPKEKGVIKPYSNPDGLSWEDILKKYRITGVKFKDGYPNFSDISKGTVEIENFQTGKSEAKTYNFTQAWKELAKQRGCTVDEVKKWMKESYYTWHECEDKRTMQKVPHEVHANIPHNGGRSQE